MVNFSHNSADRLDSSQDYTKDNIVLTTRFANLGRGTAEADDFRKSLDGVIEQIILTRTYTLGTAQDLPDLD